MWTTLKKRCPHAHSATTTPNSIQNHLKSPTRIPDEAKFIVDGDYRLVRLARKPRLRGPRDGWRGGREAEQFHLAFVQICGGEFAELLTEHSKSTAAHH